MQEMIRHAVRVGADVLICPVERSSTIFVTEQKPVELRSTGQLRASAPYVIWLLRSVSAGNPAPVGIEQLSGFEDNRWTGFHVWGRVVLWRCVFGAWLAVAGCIAAAWAKDMALVSNKSNGVTEVSMAELVKICKGQTSRWPKGKPVTFFSLNPAATEMKLVLEKVYGMSSDEVSALITAPTTAGRIIPPSSW